MTSSGDLQDLLMCIPSLFSGITRTTHSQLDILDHVKFKKLEGLKDVESVFVLVLQTALMATVPSYSNHDVDLCLQKFGEGIEPSPLLISQEVADASPFPIETIVNDKRFQISIQLLKYKLDDEKGWQSNVECRDDNVISWISSILEPTISASIRHLTKTSAIPETVLFDLLLRKPSNELEYMSLFEIYCKWSEGVNLKDQEKLYYLKQFENFSGETYKNRNLIIPPAFANLFDYALRYKLETLPRLVQSFLDENNTKSPQILDQVSELIWKLCYDHSGKNTSRPSRFYKISQSRIIKVINRLISENENFDINVTTLLGVSNLTFYTDFRKSFTLFKEAKKRFDRWQLESFDIDGFEKIVSTVGGDIFPKSGTWSFEEVRIIRKDYNIKFLCNSILLLAVNSKNRNLVYREFFNVLKNSDAELLCQYPELWNFVLIKLNHHSMLNDVTCKELFELYLQKYDGHIRNHVALDLILNNIDHPKLFFDIIRKLDFREFDDLNLSRCISKLYKMAKIIGESDEGDVSLRSHEDPLTYPLGTDYDSSFYQLIDHYTDVVKPSKSKKKRVCDNYRLEKFDIMGFKTPIDLARYLYDSAKFKSSKLNSSYLLGESIVTPADTYERYMKMDACTKLTPVTISSLFVSVLRLREMSSYSSTKWISPVEERVAKHQIMSKMAKGEEDDNDEIELSSKPIDVALREFDRHVSRSYGDFVNGKVYPDDNLLAVYLKSVSEFRKMSRIYEFLDKMVDIRYPMKLLVFRLYLGIIPEADKQELLNCLNGYHKRFETLRKCRSEYELKMVKKNLEPITARGRFKDFVSKFEFTWDVIRNWEWPGKF
ncbi:hypothetical protein FOA43_003474 [Brettanomyces nanus]|uniref:Uncharacterized protein n=1 Tax=Eeniella nana TaxID=13502 RepID=A0A875S552_EENNA|nr:uncharacterized protein FOA43_003474 [Brettanomyces nanus]QPG76088.1 hypothetical protein FOA43_003474 [Brettanomyces nanus]